MKHILLAGALMLATSPAAFAACQNVVQPNPSTNLQTFQCDSDNQAADTDDVKFFLSKTTAAVTTIDGSLVKNTALSSFQNIEVKSNAPFLQTGNGFAEIDSADAGDKPSRNLLTQFTFTPIIPSLLDTKPPRNFLGFDGFIGRGQVDPELATKVGNKTTFSWDGDVFLDIAFVGGGTQTLEFFGDTKKDDFGAIGFDEINEPGALIDSVTMRLDATGAFNEVKQFDFSVPGAVSGVPEPSTWLLGLTGFGFIAALGWKRKRTARYALPA